MLHCEVQTVLFQGLFVNQSFFWLEIELRQGKSPVFRPSGIAKKAFQNITFLFGHQTSPLRSQFQVLLVKTFAT